MHNKILYFIIGLIAIPVLIVAIPLGVVVTFIIEIGQYIVEYSNGEHK